MYQNTISKIISFIILTYAISWGIFTLPQAYLDLAMLVPGIIAIFLSIIFKDKLKILFKLGTLSNFFKGFFISCLAFTIFISLATLLSLGSFGLSEEAIKYNNSAVIKAWSRFLIFGMPYMLSVNFAFAIFEEIGWRGYLLKNLSSKIKSFAIRSLLIGLIWGIWHLPIYIASGTSTAAIFIFLINVCLISIVYTRLYESNNSIWGTSIAHATHNVLFNTVLPTITLTQNAHPFLWGEEGLLVTASYSSLILFTIARRLIYKHARSTSTPKLEY